MGTHGSVRGKGQPAMMSKGHGHKPSQPKSCPEHAWGCQDTRFAHVPAVLAAPNHPHLPLSQAVKSLGTQNIPPLTPHQTSTCLSVQTDPPATPPCRSHRSFVTRMAKSTSNRQLLHCARRWAREKGERSPSFPARGGTCPLDKHPRVPLWHLAARRVRTDGETKARHRDPRVLVTGTARDGSAGWLCHCHHPLGAPGAQAQLHQDAAPSLEVAGSQQQVRGKVPARSLLPGPAAPGLSPR